MASDQRPLLARPVPDESAGTPAFPVHSANVPMTDWTGLSSLPWGVPLDEWPEHGVQPLILRRGESRHPVLFLESGGRRYAIKETSPASAQQEIAAFKELRRRGCCTLEPVGYVVVHGEPVVAGEFAGHVLYESGDIGYCITRLAEHVLPQSVLYRYPFTEVNKRLLWSAVAELLLNLHEAGVYWGDPSLANVLIDLSDHRLTAVMADAETAEIVGGALSEGLRKADLEAFTESLEWQAEDIRLSRGLSTETPLVTQSDVAYLRRCYDGLSAERKRTLTVGEQDHVQVLDLLRRMSRLNLLGYGVLQFVRRGTNLVHSELESGLAGTGAVVHLWQTATLRPGWYVRRLHEYLGVRVPHVYARRLYQHLLVHKWLLSERAGQDVGMSAAASNWYRRYHQPLLTWIAAYLPVTDTGTTYGTYLSILDHTWAMSRREGREVPIEEGAMDYALGFAHVPKSSFARVDPEID
jgi:Domain of unknown function (DUF4032)